MVEELHRQKLLQIKQDVDNIDVLKDELNTLKLLDKNFLDDKDKEE